MSEWRTRLTRCRTSYRVILKLLTGINKEDGTAIIMVTHNRNIFEKYHGRVFVCKDESCEENVNDEVIDLALTI